MTGFLLTAKQKLMLCINKRLYRSHRPDRSNGNSGSNRPDRSHRPDRSNGNSGSNRSDGSHRPDRSNGNSGSNRPNRPHRSDRSHRVRRGGWRSCDDPSR